MKRIVVPVAALAVTIAAFAGCSKNDTTSTTATTSAQASSGNNASTTEAKSGTSEKKGATTSTAPGKDGAITLPGNVTVPDGVSIPGGGDLDKTMADAQKCIDMATGYAGLFTPLLGGEVSNADKAKIKTALEDMKQNVPSSIADDIETIESGIQDANSLTEVGEFMSSEKFNTANDAINTYLTTECNKVGK